MSNSDQILQIWSDFWDKINVGFISHKNLGKKLTLYTAPILGIVYEQVIQNIIEFFITDLRLLLRQAFEKRWEGQVVGKSSFWVVSRRRQLCREELPHKSIVNNRKSLKLPDRPFPSFSNSISSFHFGTPILLHCQWQAKYIFCTYLHLVKAWRAGVMWRDICWAGLGHSLCPSYFQDNPCLLLTSDVHEDDMGE